MSSPPSADAQQIGEDQEAKFPEIGEVFEDRYHIESLLGTGGYAKVYRAEQVDLERDVAIKVLSPVVQNVESAQSNSGSVESIMIRFEREAKVVSQLRSPYTVTMYDYGRTDSNLLYMVLEYIDGITLGDADIPMAPDRVARILIQVLKSLHEAHDADLLHRDLKPANIMIYEHLGEADQVKLLDFGIAKLIGKSRERRQNEQDLTGEQTLLGTPRYMAPEQIEGDEVGPPRDIYSLGLIAYEMLVGEKAITEDDSIKIMAKHISDEPLRVPPNAEVDPTLQTIIDRMLAKDLDQRYSAAEEVIDDLQRYQRGMPVQGGPAPTGATGETPSGDRAADAPTSTDGSEEPETSTPLTLAVAGVAILLVTGIAALVIWGSGQSPSVADESSGPAESSSPSAAASPAETTEPPAKQPVRIVSTPSGATVRIDGRQRGQTPLTVSPDDLTVPAAIQVEYASQTHQRKLSEYGEELSFEFEASDDDRDSPPPSGAADKPEGADDSPSDENAEPADESAPAGGETENAPDREETSDPSSPEDSSGAARSAEPSEPSQPSSSDETDESGKTSGSAESARTDESGETGGAAESGGSDPADGSDDSGASGQSDDGPEFLPLE